MFIDFEGIDGSGKTTLSNRVATRLQRLGHRVLHAREGGELQSPLARVIRELTRDSRHLAMSARAEFFLNLARDAQQLEEVIAPSLARGEVCISDRYLYSQLALSGGGRGLPTPPLESACELAAQGLWPDLVILVDVDPELARLRKRVGKAGTTKTNERESRKGLAGAGLSVRAREYFRELARRDPGRWLILENESQPLWVLEERVVEAIVARLERRDPAVRPTVPPVVQGSPSPERIEDVEGRFFRALDQVEAREPALAVGLLSGIPGLAAHQRRLGAVERLPGLVAQSLRGLADEPAWSLRELLMELAPGSVAQSLGVDPSPRSMGLRARLYAKAPAEVLNGLKSNDSSDAWSLRELALKQGRLAEVLTGLNGVDSERAWAVRERGLAEQLWPEVARSLGGLSTLAAEELRTRLVAHDRLAVLRSTMGLDTPVAQRLRRELFELAPKWVLRSLTGLLTDESFALRERGADLTKEAIDSLDGLDHPRAWALRETHAYRWCATVLSSMKGLALSPRLEELMLRVLARTPGRLPVLRNAYAVVATAQYRGPQANTPPRPNVPSEAPAPL